MDYEAMRFCKTNFSTTTISLIIPVDWKNPLRAILGTVFLILFSSPAFPYATYDGCKDCHGGFEEDNYISKKDGSSWGTDLMDGHEAFVSNNCDTCHKTGSKGEVFLNFSKDSTFNMSCVGCHGRVEDIDNSCSSAPGGLEVNCGSGVGLRRHHEAEVGANTCNSCHSSNPTPVGEDVAPFYYGKSGITISDSCDADGSESKYGATGLDNDGDVVIDGSDPDCQIVSNTPPTQPGTLSASAITVNSATVSWGASMDVNGDTISYQVDYRHNGNVSWTDGGSTNSTSRALSGLDSGQSYDVRVTPTDDMDAGTARTTLNLFETTFVNTPPTQPGTLLATSISPDSARISWEASTDVDDDTISYLVEYRRNGEIPWTNGGNTNNTSQPLSGLDPSQSYDVQVTPNDATDDGTARTALNLFQTFAPGEIIFGDGFE